LEIQPLHSFPTRRSSDLSLSKAQNILNEAKKTNNMNKDVQRQLDNIILENGNSEAEVVQARGEENLLSKRLDKIDYEVDRTYTRSEEHTSELQSRFDLVC